MEKKQNEQIHIIVEIKEKSRTTETMTATLEFLEFYQDVKEYLETKPNTQIVRRVTSEYSYGRTSRYILCKMEDQITGGFINFVFELRISGDLLSEDWEFLSLKNRSDVIKEFETKCPQWSFTAGQFDFIVGFIKNEDEDTIIEESTDKSYSAALARVKEAHT